MDTNISFARKGHYYEFRYYFGAHTLTIGCTQRRRKTTSTGQPTYDPVIGEAVNLALNGGPTFYLRIAEGSYSLIITERPFTPGQLKALLACGWGKDKVEEAREAIRKLNWA